MAFEHYHIMFKSDMADAPEKLGGEIYVSMKSAVQDFCARLGMHASRQIIKMMGHVRHCHDRGLILRSHPVKGTPFMWIAICRRDSCDLDRAASHAWSCGILDR